MTPFGCFSVLSVMCVWVVAQNSLGGSGGPVGSPPIANFVTGGFSNLYYSFDGSIWYSYPGSLSHRGIAPCFILFGPLTTRLSM
jgi:hypothetical protein